MKKYHTICTDTIAEERFYCDACKEVLGEFSLESSSAAAQSQSQSQDSTVHSASDAEGAPEDNPDEEDYGVKEVTGIGLLPDEDTELTIVHFEFAWEDTLDPVTNVLEQHSNSAVPFYLANGSRKLLDRYFVDWPVFEDAILSQSDSSVNAAALNPCWERLVAGYISLIEKIAPPAFEHVKIRQHYGAESPAALQCFRSDCYEILISVTLDVLRGICGAGLQYMAATNSDLRAWLINNRAKTYKRPCIYVIEFTDKVGRAPTWKHFRSIFRGVKWYYRQRDQEQRDWAQRVEAKLSKGSGKPFLTEQMRASLGELLRNLRPKCRTDATENDRMPFVLKDVGYTQHGHSRIRHHETGSASANPLLAIFRIVARMLDDVPRDMYDMHGDVVFLCFREIQAPLGEIIFSLMAESYIETGTGFNSVEAGIQTQGLMNFEDSWSIWSAATPGQTPCVQNHAAETARLQSRAQALEVGERELDERRTEALQWHLDELKAIEDSTAAVSGLVGRISDTSIA